MVVPSALVRDGVLIWEDWGVGVRGEERMIDGRESRRRAVEESILIRMKQYGVDDCRRENFSQEYKGVAAGDQQVARYLTLLSNVLSAEKHGPRGLR